MLAGTGPVPLGVGPTRYVGPVTITDAATFCATVVDEWVRSGVTDAFVAPGSRSTPLALALVADDRLDVHVFHDERAASFAALGHGLATGVPAVVLCTSGTAGAHFHAAVLEADLSSVPLLVCTADRPPELWDIGAPQTIDQTRLFGQAVRFFAEPGVPDAATSRSWRSVASRAFAEAVGWAARPGPVHLNLSFRDPLVGEPGSLPPGRPDGRPWHRAPRIEHGDDADGWPDLVNDGRAVGGVIIAGAGTPDPVSVMELAARLGWPVLADHRSHCRDGAHAIAHFDSLLRIPGFAAEARPEVVVRFGEALASKVLGQWLSTSDAEVITVVDRGRWTDPERVAGTVLADRYAAAGLLASLPADLDPAPDLERWRCADSTAALAIAELLARSAPDGAADSEIAVVRAVVGTTPADGALVLASSMPVRDAEWYGPPRTDLDVFANRGANGIDGTVATAIGVALTGKATTVVVGDVAFLHDSSALIGLADRGIDLRIVVVDNDGGGIFSFLPQAELLDAPIYEQLFGTPHGTDLAALAAAHGLAVEARVPASTDGVSVTVVPSDRQRNAAIHREINGAVAAAVSADGRH